MHNSGAVVFEQYRLRRAGWHSAVGAYCFQLLFESKTKSAAPLVRLPWDVLLFEVGTADRLRCALHT